MAYSQTTWGALQASLAERLDDDGMVFWSADELQVYLSEALRVWGAATGYWRERGTFQTANGVAFYALQTSLSSLLGFTVTDRDTLKSIQYSLLESAASQSGTWVPTGMFTLNQVAGEIQDHRNVMLKEAGCVLTRSSQAMPAPPNGRVTLGDATIDVRRAVWRDALYSNNHVLFRVDEWGLAAAQPLWESSPDTPYSYTIAGTRPLELSLAPPPAVSGTLDLITVDVGATLNPASGATALGIQDNISPAVKWGAISMVTKGDGQQTDIIRRTMADRRWNEMVEIAKMMPLIINAQLNGISVLPCTLYDLDASYGNWQDSTGVPEDIAICGPNLIAIRPVPNGIYSVTLDVCRNAPIPANDAAFVQVGEENLEQILDYAEYAALFKTAGEDLISVEPLIKGFYEAAAVYNSRIRANALFAKTIFGQGDKEEMQRPRMTEVGRG